MKILPTMKLGNKPLIAPGVKAAMARRIRKVMLRIIWTKRKRKRKFLELESLERPS